ncbi:MAG: histidine phosphatase family protein [Saprospiraceae bacterium]|nr:histidine phosphatase family protein [Saprospiraceae bacterium]
MTKSRVLYLLRHGETDHNRFGIIQGRGVDSKLNETGLRQAKAFYARYEQEAFDLLMCSSLTRSYQTISSFEHSGMTVLRDSRIDEISWGEHEGQPGIPERLERFQAIVEAWKSGDFDQKSAGGESARELGHRLAEFLEELQRREFSKALICTHGRTLRAMVCLLKSWSLSNMERVGHSNTGLYLLQFNGRGWTFLKENDISHLNLEAQR